MSDSDPAHADPANLDHLRATPSERQRTVQACDKCRERKTKCSGEHPVCQRCHTRGLICQYSIREPRTRGPSKARLRNAVSTTDLRSSPKPRAFSHGAPHFEAERSPHQRRQPYPLDEVLAGYPSLRRVPSIHDVHMNTTAFEAVGETYMQSYAFDENSYQSPTFPPRHSQYMASNSQTPQWRDVRRVQSHSTLIGSSGGSFGQSTQITYPPPNALENVERHASYGQWSSQERISPPPISIFNTYESFPPQVAPPLEPQMSHLLSPKVHPWGYHSDGGSTGSEPISRSEPNVEYSPSSSEDVSGSSPRINTLSTYTRFDEAGMNAGIHHVPSQNGCTPHFHGDPVFVPADHYTPRGTLARHVSESNMHMQYQAVYP